MITIAVCTWNRARLLEKTLSSFTRLDIPTGLEWEVVVVNNNSPDHTGAIIEGYAAKLPIRHFLEKNQGIAHARNRAAREARGEIILWTDDDVQVKPNWVRDYLTAIAAHPDCGFFGGPVELDFDGVPPEWLVEGLDIVGGALGRVRVADDCAIGITAQLPFNCNMAVRREHHLARPYDTRYGRSAGALLSGEETVFMQELLARGVKGWWVPQVPVLHCVPIERQTISHLRKALNGVGHELGIRSPATGKFRIRSVPVWLWREAVTNEVKFRFGRLVRSRKWHSHFAAATIARGRIERALKDRGAAENAGAAGCISPG